MGFRETGSTETEYREVTSLEDLVELLNELYSENTECSECIDEGDSGENDATLSEKLNIITHAILDDIIAGDLAVENADELHALISVVQILESKK